MTTPYPYVALLCSRYILLAKKEGLTCNRETESQRALVNSSQQQGKEQHQVLCSQRRAFIAKLEDD